MIEKTPSIAAPFRRQLFEPYDRIIYNPIGHFPLHSQKKIKKPEETIPITDEDGNEFYRLSDIKKKIREEIAKKEEEIRQRFLKDLKDELVINNIQRRNQSDLERDTDSPKVDDSVKDSDLPRGDESKDNDSTNDDDAMHLYL